MPLPSQWCPPPLSLQTKLTELRGAYAGIEDQLTGRMPLAYTQLVQIKVDLLIGFTPLALIHSVGGVGAMAMYNLGVTGALGESDSGPNTGTFMLGATAAGGSALAASAASTALMLLM